MPYSNKIGICSDHAGYEVKEHIKAQLVARGLQVEDFGCPSADRCDYPDYAHPMGQALQSGALERGISVCGSGNGISMVMNKYPRVRAALCWTKELAELARQHNDANVLSIPTRFVSLETAEAMVSAFLDTDFEGGRHTARVAKIPIQD